MHRSTCTSFEQLDALYSRKVGQALRARSFDQFKAVELGADNLNFDDVSKLNMDTLKEGSLAAQVLEAIESGDAEALRRVATAKRVLAAAEATIDEPNFFTQIRLLNDLRKDNFFLSPSTWIQRNACGWRCGQFRTWVLRILPLLHLRHAA